MCVTRDGVDSPRLLAGGEGSVHQQHQGHPGQRGQERRDGAAVWQLHRRGSHLAAGGADLPRHPAQHSALQLGQVGVWVGPQWVGGPLATVGGWAAGHSGWVGRWPQWVGGPQATVGGWAAGHSGWVGRWPQCVGGPLATVGGWAAGHSGWVGHWPQWVGGPLATVGGWAAGHSGWVGRWPQWVGGPLATVGGWAAGHGGGSSSVHWQVVPVQQVSRPVCKSVEPHRPVPGTGYKACSSATLHLAPVKGS